MKKKTLALLLSMGMAVGRLLDHGGEVDRVDQLRLWEGVGDAPQGAAAAPRTPQRQAAGQMPPRQPRQAAGRAPRQRQQEERVPQQLGRRSR